MHLLNRSDPSTAPNDSVTVDPPPTEATAAATRFQQSFDRLSDQVHRAFVGQNDLVDHVISALFADGHVLIEGVPGLGKTLLVRTLASAVDVSFSRIQFTPDLMPADITGTMTLVEGAADRHELHFEPGPIMAHIVLADEINRATPKTQSALLEAMQERQVSVGRQTLELPAPFMVLATQNPIEQEGTYPLPEAQLDRFLVKLLVSYPQEREYDAILNRTTGVETPEIKPVTTADEVLELRQIVRRVVVSEQVRRYAIRLVMATQPGSPYAPSRVGEDVSLGVSPRGAQALILLGKVRALRDGRYAVACKDIRDVAAPVLRHRLQLGFEALSRGVQPDDLIEVVLEHVSELTDG